MNRTILKIKLAYVGTEPHWKVYRFDPKQFLWWVLDEWEYVALVRHVDWPRFKREFENHSGPVEVVRDDTY